MFHSISWQSYWLTLALLTAGYYLAIYLLYYRNDFHIRIPGRVSREDASTREALAIREHQPRSAVPSSLFEGEDPTESTLPEEDNAEGVVYSCMDELTAFFVEAKRRKWAKEELLQALRRILQKYPSLKTSDYKESLSNVIVTQCEHHCSIHLQAEDTVRVW